MVILVATSELFIAASKLVALLVFCRAGRLSIVYFWCLPWVRTKLSSVAVIEVKTPCCLDNFLRKTDGLPLGVFGDVGGKKKSNALAAVTSGVFDAAFALFLIACSF